MDICDLHCHSCFSDGTYSPEEMVNMAYGAGISAIALTDHNTMAGNEDLIKAASGKIEVCPGCEITTQAEGVELHLLGLFLDSDCSDRIQNELDTQNRRKEESNRQTITRLANAGYDVDYEDFVSFSGNGIKNRVHIARYLMHKNYVLDINDAFNGLLSTGMGYYRETEKLDFYNMIELINESGGLSVWAHPLFDLDRDKFEIIISKAKKHGLDGVEVYYSSYSEAETDFMIEKSEEYNLLKSGGTDFHGDNKPDINIGTGYGNLSVPYELFCKMKDFSDERKKKHIIK